MSYISKMVEIKVFLNEIKIENIYIFWMVTQFYQKLYGIKGTYWKATEKPSKKKKKIQLSPKNQKTQKL